VCLTALHSQADNEFYSSQGNKRNYGYVTYFTVLLVWEIIPTYLIVIFFRIRKPSPHSVSLLIHYM